MWLSNDDHEMEELGVWDFRKDLLKIFFVFNCATQTHSDLVHYSVISVVVRARNVLW